MPRIVTWEQAQAACGYTDAQKGRVEPLLDWVSALAEQIIGRSIFLADKAELLSGGGRASLLLDRAPIVTIHSIKVSAFRDWANVQPLDESLYSVRPSTGVINLLDGVWPIGRFNVQVFYGAGWAEGAFPSDIVKACLDCLQATWGKVQASAYGIKSMSMTDGTNVTYDFDVPYLAKKTFEAYRFERC